MKEDESLCDDNLERIGLIKEIDTTALIEKVQESNKKKKLRIQDFMYAFAVVIIFMFQIIIVKRLGMVACIFLNFFLVLPAPVLILVKSTKIYSKGDDMR